MRQRFEAEKTSLQSTILRLQSEKSALHAVVDRLRDDLAATKLQLFELQKFEKPLGGQPGRRTSPATVDSWLLDIGHLAESPCLIEFHREWAKFSNHEITFALCKQDEMNANRIFSHCEWVVHSLSRKHPAVFKVGITENVIDRWCQKTYCYKNDKFDRWQGMIVLFVGSSSLVCGLVESYLIHRFIGRPGCWNVALGGESAKPASNLYFTYCVWRSLAPPVK